MKKLFIAALALFMLTACTKDNTTDTSTSTTGAAKDPNEISLVQETSKLENEKGEIISVTYFAQGENIAVKLEQNGKPEEVLIAKKINTKGEPVFANEKIMWEGALGSGGKTTDGQGNVVQYREIEESK